MTSRRLSSAWSLPAILVGAAVASVAVLAAAQDPFAPADPFSESGKTDPTPKPAPKKTTEQPAPPETDPNVLAIRGSNPRTASELVQAVENLTNLGRPDEAKRYLRRLIASNFEDQVLWSLQRRYGSGLFIRFSIEESLQPEGRTFADAVLAATSRMVRDPERLENLIRQLSDPSREVRYGALVELRAAGEAAAVALIRVLADPSRTAEHAVVTAALARLGTDAEGPLLGTLQSPNGEVRQRARQALAGLDSPLVIPFLLRPAVSATIPSQLRQSARDALQHAAGGIPTPSAAEGYLHREALAYFHGKPTGEVDHENLVRSWSWDDAQQAPVATRIPPRTASLRMASLVAGELVQLAPKNPEYRKLYVAARLEAAKLQVGWQHLLPRDAGTAFHEATQLTSPALEEVLEFALRGGHPAAAVATLEVLGVTAAPQVLFTSSGEPGPVARALQNPNRRIRFAALQAVLRINPRERFPGASFVSESLGYFASNTGTPRVLIIHPRTELAQTLAGILLEIGYEAEIAVSGSEAVQLAARDSNFDFILISDAVDQPGVAELLQRLRRQPRAAQLPIAVLAREENYERSEQLTSADPLAMVFTAPYEPAGMAFLIGRLRERAGENYAPPEERIRQAAWALDAMALLAGQPERYGFYELIAQQPAVERATATPQLCDRALKVLGLLATPGAQRWLVSVASQNNRAIEQRRAAAAAFDTAIRRRGLLLTQTEILAQYDRYNASATQDKETQQVLGAVLDSIELPAAEEEQSPSR